MYVRRRLDSFDPPLLGATLSLVLLGALAVASATLEGSLSTGLWRNQLVWLLIALGGANASLKTPTTVTTSSSTRSERPSTVGSDPKTRSQNPCERTTASAA